MVREFFISFYLFIFRLVFNLFNLAPLQDKTVFVVSFGDNAMAVLQQLKTEMPNHPTIVLQSSSCSLDFSSLSNRVVPYESKNPLQFFRAIYHLATAKHIFIDNYYGFLAVTDFRPEVI